MTKSMLTTFDNPFNPFTQFSDWRNFDIEKGYYCCELLARFVHTSDELSDEENEQEIERAIDLIVKRDDCTNLFVKVKKEINSD